MGMFNVRKPRGFNHQYIYVDERKEKLAKMEEDAKRKPAHLGVILAIIALLIFLWHYLQTGSWSF